MLVGFDLADENETDASESGVSWSDCAAETGSDGISGNAFPEFSYKGRKIRAEVFLIPELLWLILITLWRMLSHERSKEKINKKKKRQFKICQEKIKKHNLEMKLIDAEYTFDNNKVLFYFTADGRIDFRELVKDLASIFRPASSCAR